MAIAKQSFLNIIVSGVKVVIFLSYFYKEKV